MGSRRTSRSTRQGSFTILNQQSIVGNQGWSRDRASAGATFHGLVWSRMVPIWHASVSDGFVQAFHFAQAADRVKSASGTADDTSNPQPGGTAVTHDGTQLLWRRWIERHCQIDLPSGKRVASITNCEAALRREAGGEAFSNHHQLGKAVRRRTMMTAKLELTTIVVDPQRAAEGLSLINMPQHWMGRVGRD